METISLKMEDTFLETIERAMKKHNYSTKTEFIREAIREKLNTLEKQESAMRALMAHGAGRKKHGIITDEEIHAAREKIAKQMAKEFGIELD
ncbi:hypothetical protein HYU19_01865 [Candidatus Woesearchaeota archaeon]|nr:hypothetical protein [Candidatus Woesearchaeota archaeon]